MPGIYRTTLAFQGNWTLRGTEFAENTILLPKEKEKVIVDEFGNRANPENVALLTVERGSTLRLENLTLQDDFVPITLDESNLPPDEGIGTQAYSQLYARVATGVIVKENARLVADNVRFLNWLLSALSVAGYGEAVVQNSEFFCPSNVLIEPGLFIEGKASFTQSLFDHCLVDSLALFGQLEFSESEFRSAGISGGETLTVTKSLFRDPFIFGPHADFTRNTFLQISPAAKTTLIDNTFEISDKFLKYGDILKYKNTRTFEALPVFGYLTAINNVFRGFSVALNLFNLSHGNVNVQLVQNTFEHNQTALFFIGLGPYILEENRFIDNEECAIVFVLAFRTDSLQLQGKDNEFQGNAQDICPADFPLPEGFVKQTM